MFVPTLPLLLAFDLDGTLIPDQGRDVDQMTAHAWQRLRRHGVKLAIITGRDEVPPTLLDTLRPDAVAPNNGAVVTVQGEVHHEAFLSEPDVTAALAHGLSQAQTLVVTREGPFLAWPETEEVPPHVHAWMNRYGVPLLTDGARRAAFKVRFHHPQAAEFAARLRESHPHLVVMGGCEPYLTSVCVTAAEADKAVALTRIAAALGIPLSRTVAFGDSDNDVTMLGEAGHAVQVGTQPYLKGVADEQIPEQSGVGPYLLRLAGWLTAGEWGYAPT